MKYLRVVWVVILLALVLVLTNSFGLAQRLLFGMQPPYHWTNNRATEDDVEISYFDVNGKSCAEVYRFKLVNSEYKVYGYGFSDKFETLEQAKAKAERECR